MQNRIEPPILTSRLMTIVLAMSLVVLGVLGVTLYNMFPLNRPQIFFLQTKLRDNLEIQLTEMPPISENLDAYKQAFVREYVRHRNEIFSNHKVMQRKWNSADGAVRTMSSDKVYADFARTGMFIAMMSSMPDFDFKCPVLFDGAPFYIDGAYHVKIQYYCENSTGLLPKKNYTIKLKLEDEGNDRIKWSDRIENPLGLRVTDYQIIEGDGDPLDSYFLPM